MIRKRCESIGTHSRTNLILLFKSCNKYIVKKFIKPNENVAHIYNTIFLKVILLFSSILYSTSSEANTTIRLYIKLREI